MLYRIKKNANFEVQYNYMKINLRNGIDKLLFGMKPKDVLAIYGTPDREYKDEDGNTIFSYNSLKMRLTFYLEEESKLSYIVASSSDLELLENKIIGKKILEAKKELSPKGIVKFTKEDFDTYENYFNEDHWFILQTEFEEVVKFEMGAIINDKDEFDWKFKS